MRRTLKLDCLLQQLINQSIAFLVSNNDLNSVTSVEEARSQIAQAEVIEGLEGPVRSEIHACYSNKMINSKGISPKTII